MKRRFLRGTVAAMLGAAACAGTFPMAARAEAYTMRLNLPDALGNVFGQAAIRFASSVAHRSNGQLKIELYPNLQLATTAETVNALVSGVIDFGLQASAYLVPLVPKFAVFDLPFLFPNLDAGFRVVDGAIGSELFAELETKGIVGLAWGTGGFRQLETTTKAVTSVEDMRGLRIRVQNGPVQVATYQSLGAIPVVIDFSETFTALSSHAVDGLDTNLDGITTGKYYTVVKHVAMFNHIFSVIPLMGSKRKLDALPAALQKIVREEGRGIVGYWRSQQSQQVARDVQILKDNGVAFTEIRHAAFRKAVDPVYAGVQSKLGGDLLARIARVAS